VGVAGPFPEPDAIQRRLRKRYETEDFSIVAPAGAKTRLAMVFNLQEVRDDLLPPASGLRLFRGRCTVELAHRGGASLRRTLYSRVESNRSARGAGRIIAGYLEDRVWCTVSEVLEGIVLEESE